MKKTFVLGLTLLSMNTAVYGQFFTITKERGNGNIVTEEGLEDRGAKEALPSSGCGMESFGLPTPHEVTVERDVPVFVSVKDSLMAGLLQKRMCVCLPLDFLKGTSDYGYRKDPITRCRKFHDGIDLACHNVNVYSMLPGRVEKVRYGRHGYGNYMILRHGDLKCLYGHLSVIRAREGDLVNAGTIVAVSGNTGRTVGNGHLHIRLSRNGKSIDPKPFIAYMTDYIRGLQEKMADLKFDLKPQEKLTIGNLVRVMDRCGILFPKIVAAQVLLETGYMTSHVCLGYSNLFGLYNSAKGDYYKFPSWEDSVKAYKEWIQDKYHGGDYYSFLQRMNYATDPLYIDKVRAIAHAL
jgi:hypothetical protein